MAGATQRKRKKSRMIDIQVMFNLVQCGINFSLLWSIYKNRKATDERFLVIAKHIDAMKARK